MKNALKKTQKFSKENSKSRSIFEEKSLEMGISFAKMTLRNGYGFWVSSSTLQTKPNQIWVAPLPPVML